MAQRCGPIVRCALSDGHCSAFPASHVSSKSTQKSTITVRQEMKNTQYASSHYAKRFIKAREEMHHPHHHHRHQSAPWFLLVTPAGVSPLCQKRATFRPTDSQSNQREAGRRLFTAAFRWVETAESPARLRGGPVLILISALTDYRHQPSPTVGGGATTSPSLRQSRNVHLPHHPKISLSPGDLSFFINGWTDEGE